MEVRIDDCFVKQGYRYAWRWLVLFEKHFLLKNRRSKCPNNEFSCYILGKHDFMQFDQTEMRLVDSSFSKDILLTVKVGNDDFLVKQVFRYAWRWSVLVEKHFSLKTWRSKCLNNYFSCKRVEKHDLMEFVQREIEDTLIRVLL